jgi:hypothetical protein
MGTQQTNAFLEQEGSSVSAEQHIASQTAVPQGTYIERVLENKSSDLRHRSL